MEELLIDQVWISIAISAVCYIIDHYLVLHEAYLYHNHVEEYIVFDGKYDGFEKLTKPGNRKWMPSTSFLAILMVLSLGIFAG